MGLTSEYKLTVVTDDDEQGHMSDEDLEKAIDKDVQRWTPSLATMALIKQYDIEKL